VEIRYTFDKLTYRKFHCPNTAMISSKQHCKTFGRPAFRNAKAIDDEVIWDGNDEDGVHSSHRVVNIARNTGHRIYGPPIGRLGMGELLHVVMEITV
jgi:hypothetical protein